MPFREKSAWISLLASLAIYGFYFVNLRGDADGVRLFGLLAGSMVLFTLVIIVLTVVAAVLAPKDANAPADERDRLIALKAMSGAYFAVATGAVAGMGAAFYGASGFWIANLLFVSLVAAELLKSAMQIVLYRRGA